MDEVYAVTTSDNPYSPFDQFDQWWAFDRAMGYFTLEYQARIAHTSSALSDEENLAIINDAIDDIVRLNLTGNYIKVKPSDYPRAHAQ